MFGERAQAFAEFDDVPITVIPLVEERKILDDLVDLHDPWQEAARPKPPRP
jgi:hypothetical protein